MRKVDRVDHDRGRRIRAALKSFNSHKMMSVAAELNVSAAALSKWVQGHPMSVDHACRLSAYLGVSLDWMLAGTVSKDSPRALTGLEQDLIDHLRDRSPQVAVLLKNIVLEIPKHQ
ncbi:helix-turn-helix transcriptional regulator [Neorhizobium sp. JUb45]|uniref:helix-turn-helix domain-containing protein n=1 Tax=Neorhizobium sp. JUb45 TaxID=2485113 RepID=UPI00104C186F|nr:helix-turn-helix transcriptional regulator [Neorhizobium sp. JUb45]